MNKATRRNFIVSAGAALGVSQAAARARTEAKEMPARVVSRDCSIVDCQSHLFFPQVLERMKRRRQDPIVYDQEETTFLKMGSWIRKVPAEYSDVTAKLAAMDAAGIEVTLLSNNDPGPEWFGEDGTEMARIIHDSIAEVCRQYPGRFYGLCTLPMQDPSAAEAELRRCVEQLDFRGVLLYTNLAGAWCDEPQFRWLFARAEQWGVPILLHPAKPMTAEQTGGYELTSTLGNMFENSIALARIIASGLLDLHPNLKLVCPHLGGTLPYISGRMDHQILSLKRSNQNLKKKPSQYLREIYMDIVSPLPEALRFALDFSGPDRLLFSSDHPWVDPALICSVVDSLDLPAADQEKIYNGNAKALFSI